MTPTIDSDHDHSAPVRLARRIARDIIERDLPVGTHMGSLPEISQHYAISVPTLRKAIAFLQDDGIVCPREGRGGGLWVAAPAQDAAVRAMYLYFTSQSLTRENLAEVRDLIDVALAERACRFIDQDIQREVERIFRDSGESDQHIARSIKEFDSVILAAARQPVLALISIVIGILEAESAPDPAFDPAAEMELRLHCARAIVAGDLSGAITSRRRLRPQPDTLSTPPGTRRLAGQIVDEIRAMIREHDLGPGDELGQETALQERLGVGRTTLRDALRQLERLGTIRVAQGRKGGIFVASAEPYAAIAMVSLYLSSIRLSFQDQIEARTILQSRAAWLAAERMTAPTGERLLAAVHDDERAAREGDRDWIQRSAHVERLIAKACCNPLLEFFVLVLIEVSLIQARREAPSLASRRDELKRMAILHHRAIIDEIVAEHPAKAAFATRMYMQETSHLVSACRQDPAGAAGRP